MEHLIEYRLEELLEYEQPTAYIVSSTDYSDNYKTPVLTAGKSFILGYTNETAGIFDRLPVIIFDDFTTAIQYVNFPFKVKSSAMKILHVNKDLVHPKYIFYRMQVIQFDHSTHKRYWIQQYSKIKVKLPPLPEQERIVARIEELFSELDKAVETLNTTKQQLAVYRQAVLAFHLTPKDNWRICKASEIGEVCLGRQRSPQNVAKDYPTKYIRAANITEDGLDLSDVLEMEFNPIERKKYFLKYNDIVLSEASGSAKQVGKPAIWKNNLPDCCFQNTVIRHRVIQENPEYVLWYYKFLYTSGYFARIVGGVGINHLGAKNFSNVPIALPELNQQQEIVSRIEAQLSVCGQIEKTIEQSLQQAEALRQSILKQAFEGRL